MCQCTTIEGRLYLRKIDPRCTIVSWWNIMQCLTYDCQSCSRNASLTFCSTSTWENENFWSNFELGRPFHKVCIFFAAFCTRLRCFEHAPNKAGNKWVMLARLNNACSLLSLVTFDDKLIMPWWQTTNMVKDSISKMRFLSPIFHDRTCILLARFSKDFPSKIHT